MCCSRHKTNTKQHEVFTRTLKTILESLGIEMHEKQPKKSYLTLSEAFYDLMSDSIPVRKSTVKTTENIKTNREVDESLYERGLLWQEIINEKEEPTAEILKTEEIDNPQLGNL